MKEIYRVPEELTFVTHTVDSLSRFRGKASSEYEKQIIGKAICDTTDEGNKLCAVFFFPHEQIPKRAPKFAIDNRRTNRWSQSIAKNIPRKVIFFSTLSRNLGKQQRRQNEFLPQTS